jgi:HlyD family secretion protein
MKKKTIFIILILIILAAAGLWYFIFREKEKPVVLQTVNPNYGYISESVTATGALEPVDTVSIGSQVSGTIKYLYADFNSTVKKGQLIAELDKSLLQAQADQFSANLQVAKSQLVYEKSNYDRQNLLYNTGAISKADYETALYQYHSAQNNVNSVASQLQGAQKNLSYADIYSPINGTVLERNISVGQTIAASFSTPTLFIIANDLTKMQVQAAVDEADIGNVKTGLRVSFTVDAFTKDVFSGTVQQVRLQPSVSANVVTYTTIINAPNNDLKLKPGMTANVNIYTKEDSNALLIPAKALKFTPDISLQKNYIIIPDTTIGMKGTSASRKTNAAKDTSAKKSGTVKHGTSSSVWIISGDTLTQKKIKTGMNDDVNVEVLSGLSVNDKVITGIETAADTQQTSTTVRSPFMPQMGGAKKPPAK